MVYGNSQLGWINCEQMPHFFLLVAFAFIDSAKGMTWFRLDASAQITFYKRSLIFIHKWGAVHGKNKRKPNDMGSTFRTKVFNFPMRVCSVSSIRATYSQRFPGDSVRSLFGLCLACHSVEEMFFFFVSSIECYRVVSSCTCSMVISSQLRRFELKWFLQVFF